MPREESFEPEFSEEELRVAGMRSVDVLCEALARGDLETAARYSKRLRYEVLSMLRNYDGWEVSLVSWVRRHEAPVAEEQLSVHLAANDEVKGSINADGQAAEELRSLASSLKAAIEGADRGEAETFATSLHAAALSHHDRGMSRVNEILSFIGLRCGTDMLEEALGEAMSSDMIGTEDFRERAEALMHFTRVHLQSFELEEDAEKLTFLCATCPSGGRLLQEGHYEAPYSGLRVKGPRPFTYGLSELPAYCCHEPVMEKASIEATGAPMFIVEPSGQLGVEPCKTYLYKNPADIPERFYSRLGLSKPTTIKSSS